VGFELTIPAFEQAKNVATVIGSYLVYLYNNVFSPSDFLNAKYASSEVLLAKN
jgi:hypothetical protein